MSDSNGSSSDFQEISKIADESRFFQQVTRTLNILNTLAEQGLDAREKAFEHPLTTKQACEFLSISRVTLAKYDVELEMFWTEGAGKRYPMEALKRFLNKGRRGKPFQTE